MRVARLITASTSCETCGSISQVDANGRQREVEVELKHTRRETLYSVRGISSLVKLPPHDVVIFHRGRTLQRSLSVRTSDWRSRYAFSLMSLMAVHADLRCFMRAVSSAPCRKEVRSR